MSTTNTNTSTTQQRLAAVLPFSDTTLRTEITPALAAAAAPVTAAAAEQTTVSAAAEETLTINPVSLDNSVGYYEHSTATIISGYARAGNPGDTVTVTLHGKSYSSTLGSDAMWYVSVPESDMAQIPRGNVTVSAGHTDSAGVTHQASSQFSLLPATTMSAAPILFLNKVTGDDVLSAVERGGDLLISGWARNIGENYDVTVTLNGQQYHTTTTKDSRWVITIPGADVQALPQGDITLLAALSHGNRSAEAAKTLTLNNNGAGQASPSLSIDTISADDTISLHEIGAATFVTGHASNIPPGSRVKLTISDKVFYGDVTSDGVWSVQVSQLYNARNANSTHAVVSWKDGAGNEVAASKTIHLVPTSYPYKYPMGFEIDAISVDNKVDSQEAQNALIITGSHFIGENLGFGETVYVTLNGKTYTAVVEGGDYDNHWQVTVPASDVQALPPGNYTVVASLDATMNTGERVNSTQTKTFTVVDPDIVFNPISGNNVVSGFEHGNATVISGYVQQGAPGDTVLITVNGKTYSGTVGNDNLWYVSVPESDIAAIPNGKVSVLAEHTDTSGVEHQVNSQFTLTNSNDKLPSLFMNKVTGDDIISAIERGGDLLVSGWGRFISSGYDIKVTLNGHTYSTKTTQDSRWIVTIPQEDLQALPGEGHVMLLATMQTGTRVNQVAKTLTLNHNGEGAETPVLTLDPFYGDDEVNSYELATDQYATGRAEHIAAGSTVKLTVGDKNFTGKVTSDGLWSVHVDWLVDMANGNTTHATISFQDKEGNQFADTRQITLEGQGYPYRYPMTFTFDATSGDEHLSGSEKHQDLIISSSQSSGEGMGIGGTVEVVLNGKTYTTTSEAGPDGGGFDNHWQIVIPASDVEALAPGTYTVIATLSDSFMSGSQDTVVRNVQAKIITVDDDGVATLSSSAPATDGEADLTALSAAALGLQTEQPTTIATLLANSSEKSAAAQDEPQSAAGSEATADAQTALTAAPTDMWHNASVGALASHDVAPPAEITLADMLQPHLQPVA